MLDTALITGLNHLLANAGWARSRLQPFAGRHARFDIPPLQLAFSVTSAGLLEPIPDEATPDVVILLPANAPLLLIQGLDKLMAVARVDGNADFATELSFVLRNLHWDVEEDISRVVGDIAARRLVQGTSQLAAWHRQGSDRLAANLAEYLAHENPLLLSRAEFDRFRTDIDEFTNELSRMETRMRTTI